MFKSTQNRRSLLFLVFILFMALSIFYLPQFLASSIRYINRSPLSAGGANSRIYLPENLSHTGGSSFSVPINLDTDNASIQKVYIQLTFDRQKLFLISINPVAMNNTDLKFFAPATSTQSFDTASVLRQANHTGIISFSASTASQGQPFNGSAILAVLTFTPKQYGQTNVSFIFSANKLGDTDLLIDPATDILASVGNMSLNIIKAPEEQTQTQNTQNLLQGDLNGDGVVNSADEQVFMSEYGKTGAPGFSKADLNKDGKVDLVDRSILYADFNKSK